MLPDFLPIQPFTRPARGEVILPGSKSLTNRALLLAALCSRPVTLMGALFSEDTQLMTEALRQLGTTVEANEPAKFLRIHGQRVGQGAEPVDLFVGLAGTAARFLTALCAAAPAGVYRLDGVEQMRHRPMKGLIDALRILGADISCTEVEGFFPLEIRAHGLSGGRIPIDAGESSQLLSALLMLSPLARTPVEIELVGAVRWPFVQMTTRLMEHFGQPPVVRVAESHFRLQAGTPYALRDGDTYAIEPDASAASYFLALPIVTSGQLTLLGLRGPGEGLQGDTLFANVLARVGAKIERSSNGLTAAFNASPSRYGVTENFNEFSDTFLTLAAIAPLLDGPTIIRGIAHTRKQETDRVGGMAHELTKLGQHVIETEDALEIHPRPLRPGQIIETYRDHRFAMSFGILGCHDFHGDGRSWLTIKDPACCAKTFPNFFELLESVRNRSVEN